MTVVFPDGFLDAILNPKKKRNRALKPPRPSSVYSVKEAAEILGVSPKTVIRRFRENGAITISSKKLAGRKRRRKHITIPKHLIDKYVELKSRC